MAPSLGGPLVFSAPSTATSEPQSLEFQGVGAIPVGPTTEDARVDFETGGERILRVTRAFTPGRVYTGVFHDDSRADPPYRATIALEGSADGSSPQWRFYNGSDTFRAVDVWDVTDPEARNLIEVQVEFGTMTEYRQIDAGVRSIAINVDGLEPFEATYDLGELDGSDALTYWLSEDSEARLILFQSANPPADSERAPGRMIPLAGSEPPDGSGEGS